MAAALFLLSQYLVDASISFLGFNLRFWSVFPFLLMLCGLVARFTAIGLSNTESIFERGSKSYHQLASTLDIPPIKRWRKILLPIYLPGILTAWFFVFVEVIKEIPITLITRPSGFNTLSVRIFELVSEGEWYRASIPSLVLIIIGSIAVYFSLVRERESC